jgi:type IV pilus assembly protein PilY1
MKSIIKVKIILVLLLSLMTLRPDILPAETVENYSLLPPFVTSGVPPLVMLVMGKNHKLFYEAYNDASDLNGDGALDVGYDPAIDYFGYFDSYKEYVYQNNRFEPVAYTANKKVTASGRWSGDFLNYLTMSRMDAIRKVLYGGYRSTDTATETVLERAYIPQDGHSWGKEYNSISYDGYDISDYAPLSEPAPGARHLFVSTTLSDGGEPLLRVLTNSGGRVWDWVSTERPVACVDADGAGRTCNFAYEPSGASGSWNVVPDTYFSGLTISVFDHGSTVYNSSPGNYTEFNSLLALMATQSVAPSTDTITNIDSDNSPFGDDRGEYYVTVITGTMTIPSDGEYIFSADGDDAVDFLIDFNGNGDFEIDEVVAGWYGAHDDANGNTSTVDVNKGSAVSLTAGNYDVMFRHQEKTGGDNFKLWMYTAGSNVLTDYIVRVQVAVDIDPEENCKLYPNGNYKPIGMLQKFGEPGTMHFGL